MGKLGYVTLRVAVDMVLLRLILVQGVYCFFFQPNTIAVASRYLLPFIAIARSTFHNRHCPLPLSMPSLSTSTAVASSCNTSLHYRCTLPFYPDCGSLFCCLLLFPAQEVVEFYKSWL